MISIFTDGSCIKNPGGRGGFGVIAFAPWSFTKVLYTYHEHTDSTTNNREELKAIINAMEWSMELNADNANFVIYTDSSYCCNSINKWMWTWAKNGWKTIKKEPVENQDLLSTLYIYYTTKNLNCQVEKIKGHNEKIGNELADALATNNKNKFDEWIDKGGIILPDGIYF